MFAAEATWIWSAPSGQRYNRYVCFRRRLTLAGPAAKARMMITADSRYELFVNGEWVGHGPVRSWKSPWSVDSYDIAHLLQAGENVIAVMVLHYGLGTFQYLDAQAGLLAQLDWTDRGREHRLVSDASWKALPHAGYIFPTPRIAVTQGWEEQFDARQAPGPEWMAPRLDDRRWPAARLICPVGQGDHPKLEPRDIPMLTRDPVAPASLVSVEAVRPPDYTFSLRLKEFLNPHDRTSNHPLGSLIGLTFIHSPRAQGIQFHLPNGAHGARWKLNGQVLKFDDRSLQRTDMGVSRARLRKGPNLLMAATGGSWHLAITAVNIWTDAPVRFSADRAASSPIHATWRMLGPFAPRPIDPNNWKEVYSFGPINVHPLATPETFERIWEAGTVSDAELAGPFSQPVPPQQLATADVAALCLGDRLTGAKVALDEPSAMLSESAEWTTIRRPRGGDDVRLLLDFGDELVGYTELEVDAPAGTVIDGYGFEFIQHDGRYNLTDGLNNSFRYVCRSGVQRYRTFGRRGLRYLWLVVRGMTGPVRIRRVRCLMSTYPQAGGGHFACSDPMLERIWQAGVRSVRCCSEDTYTDCPTYEQVHWVGDARNEALVDLVANGDPRLSAHCLIQAARSLQRSPLVESHVPSSWQNILPAWSFLWMRWVQEHFELTGDQRLARRLMPYLDRQVRNLGKYVNEQGLIKIVGWNMFDWAKMDTPSGGVVTHLNCLFVLGLRQAAQLATSLKNRALATKWTRLADELSQQINRHLWSPKARAYVDCIRVSGKISPVLSQQTQTAAYIAGVATGARAKRCLEIIEHAPEGFVTAGSPFYMFFQLEGLARQGRWDEMVQTIRDYWGVQIRAGATTFWETYHPKAPRKTRSHCHGWSAAPTFFLSHHVLGIGPAKPGYAQVRIAPRPGGLTWASGQVPTPHGPVRLTWQAGPEGPLGDGAGWHVRLELPDGIGALLELPTRGRLTVLQGKARMDARRSGLLQLSCSGPLVHLRVE